MTWFIIVGSLVLVSLLVLALFVSLIFRRVVSTNMVHIVQRGKSTVSYGSGQKAGNVYYAFPAAWPKIGVSVIKLPVSNFELPLPGYEAYDQDKVPFCVDVIAFFRVEETDLAAKRVTTPEDLKKQLLVIMQGAVRKVLASDQVEKIMLERAKFGQMFTDEVEDQLKEWGIKSVKAMELMDIRDTDGSEVISKVMAKKTSFVVAQARKEIADNTKNAEVAEIDARQAVEVRKQETKEAVAKRTAEADQAIGVANATSVQVQGVAKAAADEAIGKREKEKEQAVGIAGEKAQQEIKEQARITAEKDIGVKQVEQVRQAEIDRAKAIVDADKVKQQAVIKAEAEAEVVKTQTNAAKFKAETEAAGQANAVKTKAEGEASAVEMKAKAEANRVKQEGEARADITQKQGLAEAVAIKEQGLARAEAERQNQSALVQGQIDLAKEIGSNEGYQGYLVSIKTAELTASVGVEQAKALAVAMERAEVKIIANTGNPVDGVSNITKMFSPQGATNLNGWMESLAQSPFGQQMLNSGLRILGKLGNPPNKPSNAEQPEQPNQTTADKK